MLKTVQAVRRTDFYGYFCAVMRKALSIFMLAGMLLPAAAQVQGGGKAPTTDDLLKAMDSPTFVPTVRVGKVMDRGDSILYMEMNNVYVYPTLTFKNQRQMAAYMRLVRNVKTVLPIAKEANKIILETYEYLETLPDQKSRDEHMKRVERGIIQEYKPRMKKPTAAQTGDVPENEKKEEKSTESKGSAPSKRGELSIPDSPLRQFAFSSIAHSSRRLPLLSRLRRSHSKYLSSLSVLRVTNSLSPDFSYTYITPKLSNGGCVITESSSGVIMCGINPSGFCLPKTASSAFLASSIL